MKRKNPNPTSAEKHFCSEKYFIEMPEIPILCLGRTETPPKWVKQAEFWWAAPTHRGTLTQSDAQRKGKRDLYPSSNSSRSWFLHSVGALCKPSVGSAPASPVPVPWALLPECWLRISARPNNSWGRKVLQPHFVLNSHPQTETKCFKLSGLFCGAACGDGMSLFAVQNDFNPNMGIELEITLKAGLAY